MKNLTMDGMHQQRELVNLGFRYHTSGRSRYRSRKRTEISSSSLGERDFSVRLQWWRSAAVAGGGGSRGE